MEGNKIMVGRILDTVPFYLAAMVSPTGNAYFHVYFNFNSLRPMYLNFAIQSFSCKVSRCATFAVSADNFPFKTVF